MIKCWLEDQQIPFKQSAYCLNDLNGRVWHICTTNGSDFYLAELEDSKKRAGRDRIMLSLDLADPDSFTKLRNGFDTVLHVKR